MTPDMNKRSGEDDNRFFSMPVEVIRVIDKGLVQETVEKTHDYIAATESALLR